MQVIQKIKFLLHRSLIPGSSDPGSGNRLRCSRNTYIKNQRNIRIIGSVSLILLLTLTAFTLRPVSVSTDFAEATANPATTTLTVSTENSTALLDITPSSTSGTFSSSDNSGTSLAFNVSTNNITGYNLSISHASSTTPAPLVNEDLPSGSTTNDSNSLSSLPAGTSITDSDFNTSTYIGYYGYKPSKLNSQSNSNYIPAPTTNSTTLNKTTRANTASDEYTIALGANIDYTKSAGTYTNTFILTAVANNVAYTINYKDNTSDSSVSNLPTTESASVATASSFKLSSTTPTRTGYTFNKWCDGTVTHNATGNDTCSGATYSAGSAYSFASPSSTSTNVANLYAMWNVKTYSLAITFAGSGVSSVQVRTGSGTSGTLKGTVSTSGGSVSGLTYNTKYYLYPTFSSGYTLSSWTKTSSTGTLSSTTTTNPTFTMGAGNGAVTVTGKSSGYTITFKTSNASSINFNGTNYTNNQTAVIPAGTYQIYGNYGTKYAFKTWAKSGSGSFGNSAYQLTTFTVSGDATITLTGQSVTTAMQGLFVASCTDTPKPVYDTRDNEVYWIQKLADGNCWMLDNLRLGGTSTISLTSSNTHVNETKTLPASGTANFDSTNGYTNAAINIDSKNIVNTDTTENWGYGSGKYGVYYNFCAASALTFCTASNSSNASYDVCPAGWKMPTGYSTGQYQSLCDTIKGESCSASWADDGAFHTALSTPLSGYFDNGSANGQGSNGYFWSSTHSSTTSMYLLRVSSSGVGPRNFSYRYYGRSVRCVLKDTRTISDITYMQDANSEIVANTAEGATATLMDKRDNQSYLVGKLADGKLWMLDNLRLGSADFASGVNYLDSTNTNTIKSIATSTFNGWKATSGFTVYDSPKINVASANNTATTTYGSGSGKIGVYYNYCAATMQSYCYAGGSGTGDASEDVCPKGWRMPTGGSSGEYQNLYSKYSSNATNFRNALSTPHSGYFYNSSAYSQGSSGYFWSSTYYDGNGMYYLSVDSYLVSPQSVGNRNFGSSVRCVLK